MRMRARELEAGAAGCGQGQEQIQAHRTGKEPAGTRAENEDEGTRTEAGAAGCGQGRSSTGTPHRQRASRDKGRK